MFWKLFGKNSNKSKHSNPIGVTPTFEKHKLEPTLEEVFEFSPNEDERPLAIRLVTDEYHLEGLGRLKDGSYFLVSSQLNHDHKANHTTDYLCKFHFDGDGNLMDHKIVNLGVRGEYDHEDGVEEYAKLMPDAGSYSPADLFIKPFSVEFDGQQFGFITRSPEDEEDAWAVEFMPGNTMAFFEPWDSGAYDT